MIKLKADKTYYALLLILHIGVIWFFSYFPTQDGPSHIYNLVILKELIEGGENWSNYFTYELKLIPNLGFLIVSYPLLQLFSPIVVEKIFLSIYIFLFGIAAPIFLKTFGKRLFPYIFLIFPVIFNYNLFLGFYSYSITIPFFLIIVSLSWKLRDIAVTWKFLWLNIAGLSLFFFHLIPFVFFVLWLAVIDLTRKITKKNKIYNLIKLQLIIFPSLSALLFYLIKAEKYSLDFSHLGSLKRYSMLFLDLVSFSTLSLSKLQMFPAIPYIFIVIVFGYSTFKKNYFCHKRSNLLAIDKNKEPLILLAITLTMIYFIAPFRFGNGSFLNQRFPWVIFLITLPCLEIPDTFFWKLYGTKILAFIVGIFFLFNVYVIYEENVKVQEFMVASKEVEFEPFEIVMTYKVLKNDWSRVDVLIHAASYFGIFKRVINCNNYEARSNYFPVKFRESIPHMPDSFQIIHMPYTINFEDYSSIKYILGWDLNKVDRYKIKKAFSLKWEKKRMTVWERDKDEN